MRLAGLDLGAVVDAHVLEVADVDGPAVADLDDLDFFVHTLLRLGSTGLLGQTVTIPEYFRRMASSASSLAAHRSFSVSILAF
jgi:hypothetical protein